MNGLIGHYKDFKIYSERNEDLVGRLFSRGGTWSSLCFNRIPLASVQRIDWWWEEGLSRSNKNNQEATAIIQARGDGGIERLQWVLVKETGKEASGVASIKGEVVMEVCVREEDQERARTSLPCPSACRDDLTDWWAWKYYLLRRRTESVYLSIYRVFLWLVLYMSPPWLGQSGKSDSLPHQRAPLRVGITRIFMFSRVMPNTP